MKHSFRLAIIIGICLCSWGVDQTRGAGSGNSGDSGSNGNASSGSTNAPSSTPPTQTSQLAFGNVSISSQPTSEVTTLGYELTSHMAVRIADSVFRVLPASPAQAPSANAGAKPVDPKDGLIAATSLKPHSQDIYQVIIVNQKRAALMTVQYDVMLSQLDYIITQGKDADTAFQKLANPPSATPEQTQELFEQTQSELKIDGFDALAQTLTPDKVAQTAAVYAVPGIGQAKAAVDAMEGLGESIAKFYSLFRTNDVINGEALTIPTEALDALVINRLKAEGLNASSSRRIQCYSADFLPDEGDNSKILSELKQLTTVADEINDDLARIDLDNGKILPATGSTNQALDLNNPKDMSAAKNGSKFFVNSLLAVQLGAALKDQQAAQKSAISNQLKTIQSQLQTYETSVSKLFATLYGSSNSTNDKDATGDPSGSTKQTPTAQFLGTNQNSNVAAPITVTPTMSPQITINNNTASTDPTKNATNASSGNPPGSNSSTPKSTDPTGIVPPLVAILTEEALCIKLSQMPMLYLNLLSAAGATKTSNGWWNSDTSYNAGVAVDFFLAAPGTGEILASSTEDTQSPYVGATSRGWGERLPTVVTTNRNITTKSDIYEQDDVEPQTRFSITEVHQKAAGSSGPVSPQSSKGNR